MTVEAHGLGRGGVAIWICGWGFGGVFKFEALFQVGSKWTSKNGFPHDVPFVWEG